ncbi:MAG: polyribonucleotide nucleotidyltransferase [Gemmatimonadales bacterium]|nr:polyribonucleotide nucleotidyltransferase [Gemmatimonadales bacterium]MDZ4390567.1 polyribonucleotide nucleotidyltransferase [Gemmatimonadales bacterium]
MTVHRIETQFAGRPLVIETGRIAKQAAGSVLVQYGETVVLASVTASDKPSHLPFFPLTVEYKEKTYAAGKIPGGFLKREGRPSDDEILNCRIIDRSIRPLFPEGFKNEVQVFVTVLSTDQENESDVLGVLAASAALSISNIPWNGPIAAARVGKVDGNWILNPTFQQLEFSTMDVVVAGLADSIMMVEGGALEASEAEIVEALQVAQVGIREQVKLIAELVKKAGQKKAAWEAPAKNAELAKAVKAAAEKQIAKAMNGKDKAGRAAAVAAIRGEVQAALAEQFPDMGREIGAEFEELEYNAMRAQVLDKGERIDGRDTTTVRPISIEAGLLPRVHGSALFTRGQTQALVALTLGTADDEQRIDSIEVPGPSFKSFMLHYNFPPYSTGEVRPMRGTSRREIGHGALAERAIQPLLPMMADFPYTIRIVSEIMESNGSSSMASVCGSSLALMDAGVPIKAPCAGVAMGLIKEGKKVAILTDILGTEDHLGDMDFKVAGTTEGITSIQMDIKIDGLSLEIMTEALEQARQGRLHILGEMAKVITTHRPEMSKWAPRIITIQIKPDKIGDVIGPKGKTIRGIQEASGAKVNIDDTGLVTIAAVGAEAGNKAKDMVMSIVAEPEVGRVYEGPVKSTTAFGAFVEIIPGVEGLLHISELAHGRVEKTEDVVKKGDIVQVKLLEVDERGRMKLSRKALLPKE